MPLIDPAPWTDRLEQALRRYDEPLLRHVADHLLKPRNQWPVDELITRCVSTVNNIAVIDRRLHELGPAERRLLALIGHSGQPRWRVVNLIEMLTALGEPDGLKPIRRLLEAGLLYPEPASQSKPAAAKKFRSFDHWLGQGAGLWVFAHPYVTQRALGEDLGLPPCPQAASQAGTIHEADGLEWLLRLAVLWQRVRAEPLRRTQQGEFFKRDRERLLDDPLLNGSPADGLVKSPEAGLWAAALAEALGMLQEHGGELRAGEWPDGWDQGLLAALASLWAALPLLEKCPLHSPESEADAAGATGNPVASAFLLSLLFLGQLPQKGWAKSADVEKWILAHHPYWTPGSDDERPSGTPQSALGALKTLLLDCAYQLKIIQAARGESGEWLIRLSPVGRWLLGLGEKPSDAVSQGPCLLVQPSFEIVAYRQGLTPAAIGQLSRFATWKNLGAACLLQIQAESIYRALESGQTLDSIVRTLEQHGMKPTPAPVLELLRTWASKRDRVSVYPSAVLLEFANAADLKEALARGLPGARLSDRLAVVADENAIDFRNFRLMATRDFGLPPEKCVDIEDDGITLTIDLSRSDLAVETELRRFAQSLDQPAANGQRQYRLTANSLAAGQNSGFGLRDLEKWFTQRTGQPLSAAARLLIAGPVQLPLELKPHLVLHVGTPEVADGLLQLPQTRPLIQSRLGPTALAIEEQDVETLRRQLQELGLSIQN